MTEIEIVKQNICLMAKSALKRIKKHSDQESADQLFALMEVADKLGWKEDVESYLKEAGLDVRFS